MAVLGRVQQPWQTSAAARTHKLQPPLSGTPKASASTYTCHNLTDLLRKLTINIVSNLHYHVHSLKGAQTLSVKSWNSVLYLDVSFNFGTNRCIMCIHCSTNTHIMHSRLSTPPWCCNAKDTGSESQEHFLEHMRGRETTLTFALLNCQMSEQLQVEAYTGV